GLDITQKIRCCGDDFKGLISSSPEIGAFLHQISDFYIKFYHGVVGEFVCLMHDPTAVLSITDHHLISYEEMPIEIITEGEKIGMTIPATDPGRRPVKVAMAADNDAIIKTFLDICGESDTIKNHRLQDNHSTG
ncbi:MAG: nucleoside hydrolase, partial [Alphaproteobacteria bacterium]|nr:nucleoside hydrolase [Alphaproteobacteria bacterium]